MKNCVTIIKIGENIRNMNKGYAYIGMNLRCALSDTQEYNHFLLKNTTTVKNSTFNVFVLLSKVLLIESTVTNGKKLTYG